MIIQLLSCMVTIMEPEEQEQFTALPIHSLEMTHERHPIVILINNEPVGFFVLHSSDRVKEYSDNPKAMLLTSFSINHSHQGKGFFWEWHIPHGKGYELIWTRDGLRRGKQCILLQEVPLTASPNG